jgi:hypothetical protein
VTYYRWRQGFGGLKTEQVKRLKDLELKNSRLRKAVSDLTLHVAEHERAQKNCRPRVRGSLAQYLIFSSRGGGRDRSRTSSLFRPRPAPAIRKSTKSTHHQPRASGMPTSITSAPTYIGAAREHTDPSK